VTTITLELCGSYNMNPPFSSYNNMPAYRDMGGGASMPIAAIDATLLVMQCVSWGGSVSGITGTGSASGLVWQERFSFSNSGVNVQIWTAVVTGAPFGNAAYNAGVVFSGDFPDSAEAMCFGLVNASGSLDPGAGLPASTAGGTSLTYSLAYPNSALVAFQAQENYTPAIGDPSPQAYANIITRGGFQGGTEVVLGSWLYTPGTTLTNVTTYDSMSNTPNAFAIMGFAGFATVPNVIGDSLSAGESAITANALSVGTVHYVTDPSIPGTILAQAPIGGANVSPLTPVNLIVSGVSTMSIYGKFAPAAAYPPTVLINATGIEPRIYIPKENVTVKA
jgi:hypothetical protein